MKTRHFISLLLFSISVPPAIGADVKPVKAEIVDVPAERRDWGMPIGNVKVTFSDGHTEMWTKEGKALHAKASSTGIVGWSRYTQRNSHDEPVNSKLRILLSEKDIKDIDAGPFIEEWDFADHDTAVVIKSRGRHGSASIVKFDIKSGKQLGSTGGATLYKDMPEWAKPFADDKL
jgi:hypothetical protein